MKCKFIFLYFSIIIINISCTPSGSKPRQDQNLLFDAFTERFMDAFMKQHPGYAIFEAYPLYNDTLIIPTEKSFNSEIIWLNNYLDSLDTYSFDQLNMQNKISYRVLENELKKQKWQIDTFKDYEWDPSQYNIGWDVYDLLTRTSLTLDARLKILSKYLVNAPAFYDATINILHNPVKEHTLIGLQQNEGSIEIFEFMLNDSIQKSTLPSAEKEVLLKRSGESVAAIKKYISYLHSMLDDSSFVFRSYRIGEELFDQKFAFEIVSDFSAQEIYNRADLARKSYYVNMYAITKNLWPKYFKNNALPADTLLAIQQMIDVVSLQHAKPEDLTDTLHQHIKNLKTFIVSKNLFDFDINAPVNIREMPAFASGVTIASASFPPVYQKDGIAYYNISDISKLPKEETESILKEYNNYTLQFLSIHEGIPGHCLQGIYNSKHSSEKITSVFSNGTMIEGWANYCHRMMLENGWGNNTDEMWLMFYKSALRECCNVLIDYGIHCLDYTEEEVRDLLVKKAFQEEAQVMEKYNRAKVTQVQLYTYFTGVTEIESLLAKYKEEQGENYQLKNFHEQFLSYGSAPIKYIREIMLNE